MRKFIAGVALFALASCGDLSLSEFGAFSDGPATINDTSTLEFYPNDRLIVTAKAQFAERNFGLAYKSFKKAIDVAPQDPQAWLGYAASADMLRRFDKADFAYRKMQPVIGNRIEFLNNFGYSQLLRGNLQSARTYFLRAYEIDPSNEVTANNLELLRNSVSYQRRAPDDLRGI
jgi:Flp pilus assembly protein TadD